MKIQATPDYLIFADEAKTGELLDFPNVARGWGLTIDQTQSKPPLEWMNGVFNRIDKNILYMLQQGVPEWNESVLYPVNSIIKYNGKLYIALFENDNAKPSTNTTKWTTLIDGKYLPATKSGNIYDIPVNTTMNGSKLIKLNDFGVKLGNPGFEIMPNGLIRQWATMTLSATGNYNPETVNGKTYYTHYYQVTLPMAFPNNSDAVNVTLACAGMAQQSSMAGRSITANLNGSPTKLTIAVTTPEIGYIPTIHYEIIGH